MVEISKEFIDKLLAIVNIDSDSKVRSKSGYGRFELEEWPVNNGEGVCFTLWFKPTKIAIGFDKMVLRKTYNIKPYLIEDFRQQFYYEVAKFLTGHPDAHKLINHGITE